MRRWRCNSHARGRHSIERMRCHAKPKKKGGGNTHAQTQTHRHTDTDTHADTLSHFLLLCGRSLRCSIPQYEDIKSADDSPDGDVLPETRLAPLSAVEVGALQNCRWPGRAQVLRRGPVVFLLDGAHTTASCAVSGTAVCN